MKNSLKTRPDIFTCLRARFFQKSIVPTAERAITIKLQMRCLKNLQTKLGLLLQDPRKSSNSEEEGGKRRRRQSDKVFKIHGRKKTTALSRRSSQQNVWRVTSRYFTAPWFLALYGLALSLIKRSLLLFSESSVDFSSAYLLFSVF